MMKLSLMKDVFKTVNPDWDCELAKELIVNWTHENNWVKMKRASANFICKTRNCGETYIIRFNHKSERNIEYIKSELELLEYLKSKGIKVPKIIPSNNNKYIEQTNTELGTFYTSLIEFIPGNHYEIEELTEQNFLKWGQTLGELHKVFKDIPCSINRKAHEFYFEEFVRDSTGLSTKEYEEVKYLRDWLGTLDKNHDNYGLIHYDFELDNTIWDKNGVHIIDFDDSIFSWFVADIAYALCDLFNDGNDYNKNNKSYNQFIKGYRDHNNISEKELEEIPNFYRLYNYISYKRLQKSVDLEIGDDNPYWMNNLIKKLTNVMESYFKKIKENN